MKRRRRFYISPNTFDRMYHGTVLAFLAIVVVVTIAGVWLNRWRWFW